MFCRWRVYCWSDIDVFFKLISEEIPFWQKNVAALSCFFVIKGTTKKRNFCLISHPVLFYFFLQNLHLYLLLMVHVYKVYRIFILHPILMCVVLFLLKLMCWELWVVCLQFSSRPHRKIYMFPFGQPTHWKACRLEFFFFWVNSKWKWRVLAPMP